MKEAAYRRYMLVALAILYAFNNAERSAVGVLLQDIKLGLSLSDTQLGFLTGLAFAFFYAVMGIPIARWADRSNRARVISITAALCGAAVALCGMAANFVQLLLTRVAVAVGEAGGMPSSLSLIADYFSRAERPRAMSIYLQGGALSLLIGYFVAGWVNQFYGWRLTFIVLGLPSVGVATVAWLTLREPRCVTAISARVHSHPGLREVCVTLWTQRTFRQLLLFLSVMSFFNFGVLQWQPAFFVRSYGLKTGELGTWIALADIFGLILGTYVGGALASRFAAHNERLQLRAMALAIVGVGAMAGCIFLSPNLSWAFVCLGLWNALGTSTNGPLFALIQTLVPENMRATAMTLMLLFSTLVGAGLGPLLVGSLSDVLRPVVGEESLRYALLAVSPGYFLAAVYLWRASKTVTGDLASQGG